MNEINAASRSKQAAKEKAEADKIVLVKQAEADAEAPDDIPRACVAWEAEAEAEADAPDDLPGACVAIAVSGAVVVGRPDCGGFGGF